MQDTTKFKQVFESDTGSKYVLEETESAKRVLEVKETPGVGKIILAAAVAVAAAIFGLSN